MHFCFLLFCCFLVSDTFAQKPKGNRTLAWQVDLPESQLYDSSFKYANAACMEVVHLFFAWNLIEPSNNNFDQSYIARNLDVANLYYPATNTAVELQISPINTQSRSVPSDLNLVPFSSLLIINRYKALLDTLFIHMPNVKLAALNIGNESEAYLGVNASAYAQYKVFLDSVVPYARKKYYALHNEVLSVGTTLTHYGLTETATSLLCKSLNSGLDHIAVTYYPLKSDFTMKAPHVVMDDFAALVKTYPITPIYFAECGYSSSTICNSSEEKQADFYREVFKAWDSFSSQISTLTIFKSNDWSKVEVNTLAAYYGISDTAFKEYLRTLGVRNWEGDGSNKMAYEQIMCELNNRSWCKSAKCQISKTTRLQQAVNKYEIYPNPAGLSIYIKGVEPDDYLEIYNMSGQLMLTSKNPDISIEQFSKGVYLMSVIGSNGSFHTLRFLKR